MATRNAVISTIGVLLGMLSLLAIFAFPIWGLLVAGGMAEDVHSTASEIYVVIAAPYLIIVGLWALFISMAWATKPVDENRTPAPTP